MSVAKRPRGSSAVILGILPLAVLAASAPAAQEQCTRAEFATICVPAPTRPSGGGRPTNVPVNDEPVERGYKEPTISGYEVAREAAMRDAEEWESQANEYRASGNYQRAINAYGKALDAYYTNNRRKYYGRKEWETRFEWREVPLERARQAAREGRYGDVAAELKAAQGILYNKNLQNIIDEWNKDLAQRELIAARAAAFCKARLVAAIDRGRLQGLGLSLRAGAENLELYEQTAKEQKAAAEKRRNDLVVDLAFEGVGEALKSAQFKEFVQNMNADAMKKQMNEFLRATRGAPSDPEMALMLKEIARANDPIKQLEGMEKALTLAKFYKNVKDARDSSREDKSNTGYYVAQAALKTMLDLVASAPGKKMLPKLGNLGVAVNIAETVETLAYLKFLTGNVDPLVDLTEAQFKQANELTKEHKQRIDDMLKARDEWRKASGLQGAPDCR